MPWSCGTKCANGITQPAEKSPAIVSNKTTLPRLRRSACWAHCPPQLETLAAVNGPSLRWLERNRRFFSALRANCLRFDALGNGRTRIIALRTSPLASLASLGFVFKSLVDEEHLLAGGEDEFRTAFGALENLIVIFHTLLRDRGGECSGRLNYAAFERSPPGYCGASPAR